MLTIISLALLATQAFQNINSLYVSVYGSVESSNDDTLGPDNTICKKGYQQKGNECTSVCMYDSQGNHSGECLLNKHCLAGQNSDTDGYNCMKCPSGYYSRNTNKCIDTFKGDSNKDASVLVTGNGTGPLKEGGVLEQPNAKTTGTQEQEITRWLSENSTTFANTDGTGNDNNTPTLGELDALGNNGSVLCDARNGESCAPLVQKCDPNISKCPDVPD
jgi:hypothetical protein